VNGRNSKKLLVSYMLINCITPFVLLAGLCCCFIFGFPKYTIWVGMVCSVILCCILMEIIEKRSIRESYQKYMNSREEKTGVIFP